MLEAVEIVFEGRPVLVTKTEVFGSCYVFNAWEPSSVFGPHARIRYVRGRWWGAIDSRRVECDLPAYSKERSNYVHQVLSQNRELARKAIVQAFPEAATGVPYGGEIQIPLNNRF